MIKKVILLILATLFIVTGIYADDDPRWRWIDSNDYESEYLDMDSIRWDGKNLVYWLKTVNINNNVFIDKYVVDYDQKNAVSTYRVRYMQGKGREEFSDNSRFFVAPDSKLEKIINMACDKLSIPHILGNTPHSWKWIKSTDTTNYYLCDDVFNSSYDGTEYEVYIKCDKPGFYEETTRVFVNFKNYTIEDIWGRPKEITPDSPEEALYNAVKELKQDYEKSR